jgi:flavin reductase (DIM6/NTAB) family NADH-FMN oxidoreductase RutF
MRAQGTHEHLVFVWSPAGYTLEARPGEPPRRGAAVDEGDRSQRVTKVAPSPLPGDARPCAYLLPAGDNGDAPPKQEPDALSPVAVADPPQPVPEVGAASDLLALLGRYPEGASVVTVDAGGRRLGLTVGSLVSLSLDPPLVGFAVPTDEDLHDVLALAGGCGISILAGGQGWLAEHFATSKRPIAMWHALAAERGAAGAPLLVGALGWLECSVLEAVDLGSHTFFVCDVREVESSVTAPALTRTQGRYRLV